MTGTYFVKITDDHRLLVNDRELTPGGIASGDSEALLAWALDRVAQAHMGSGGSMTLNVFDYREGGYGSQNVVLQPGTVVGIEDLREASQHVYTPPMPPQDDVESEETGAPEGVESEVAPDDQGLTEESMADHVEDQHPEPEHLTPGEEPPHDERSVSGDEQQREAGEEADPASMPEATEPETEDAPLPMAVADEPEGAARAHADDVAEGEPLDVMAEQSEPSEPIALSGNDTASFTPPQTAETGDDTTTTGVPAASELDEDVTPESEAHDGEPDPVLMRHAAGPVPADDDQQMVERPAEAAPEPERPAPLEERGATAVVAPPAPEPDRGRGATRAVLPVSSVGPEPVSVSKVDARATERAQREARKQADAQAKQAAADAKKAAAERKRADDGAARAAAKRGKEDAAKREREAKQAAREAKRRGPQVADVAVEHSMRPGWMPLRDPAVPRPSLGEDGLNKPARATSKINWKVWGALALVLLSVLAVRVRMSTSPDVFTAVCIDNRTMVRESSDYNCQNQRAVYYRWFYVRNGSMVPGVNEQADPDQGSTLPPASNATIIYGFRSDGGVAGKG